MQRYAWNNPQYFPSGLCEDTGSICSYGENNANSINSLFHLYDIISHDSSVTEDSEAKLTDDKCALNLHHYFVWH